MATISLSEFADKINEIVPMFMKEFARLNISEFYKEEITLSQFSILLFLYKEVESKMSNLAHFMNVSTAAMTGIVDRLVKHGYVARQLDPRDRRIIKIKLTNKGALIVKKISQQRRQLMIKVFSKISEAEREAYLKILMHIRDVMLKEKEARQ